VQALATAIAVYGAAALSRALAFGDGTLLLMWLPTSVALVAVLAGGPGLAVPAALAMAAWAAERGAGAAAWAAAACSVAPLAAAGMLAAWNRLQPTESQFQTTVRLLLVCTGVLAPLAAAFDHRSGLLAPQLGQGGASLLYAEVVAIEAMSAAVAVRALMTLLPDRAGGFCPVEVARSGRIGLTRLEWAAWFALAGALGGSAAAGALGRPGPARLALIAGFSVSMLGAMIGNRRNTSTMLLVATLGTLWLRARIEPFSHDPAYLTNLAQFVLLACLGGAISHLLNATSAERIAHEARLRELAMTDVDSGLPNLRAFRARLESREASPAGVQLLEVRVPDVERWAELAGRAAAIAIERSAGLALADAFGGAFVAHLGTGRYGLLVPGRTDDATILARVRGAIDLQRVEAGGERGALRSFIGVVDAPGDRLGDAESVLAAMAIARQQAQADPERYRRLPLSASLVEGHRDELRAMRAVRDAVQEGRLRLLAQPIVPSDGTRDRLHYEVLSRLVDEDGREIPPATFLPLLARMGMLQVFDRQVVACTLERLGRDAALRGCTATCAINLTGPTIADPGFPTFLFERLAATGVAPETIKLEITESDPITSIEGAMRNTQALVRGGLGFALDDFGTGLATFDYLRRFAPAWVKIDGSFVRAVEDGPLERQIVDSIVRVARAAGAATVAECVETPAAIERMRELGVDFVQGWGIARPMPMETLVAFHRHGAAAVVPAGDAVRVAG
jgi:EAL domain-containing protein (putative c-di-GMP-specific phosphodiesterase class I)/GGDEF domain-containing protein